MSTIPVPPFDDFAAAQLFHRLLLLHLRELKRPGEPVGLHQFLLGQALSWHAPRGGEACRECDPPSHTYRCHNAVAQPDGGRSCAACGPPYPCRTLMSVAAISRFPVPWTPMTLVHALHAVGLTIPSGPLDDDADRLDLGPDGGFELKDTAERDRRTGRWTVSMVERGVVRETRRFTDDRALCDFLLDRARRHAFPYGWSVDRDLLETIRSGPSTAEAWWSAHSRLPYMESERSTGMLKPTPGSPP